MSSPNEIKHQYMPPGWMVPVRGAATTPAAVVDQSGDAAARARSCSPGRRVGAAAKGGQHKLLPGPLLLLRGQLVAERHGHSAAQEAVRGGEELAAATARG